MYILLHLSVILILFLVYLITNLYIKLQNNKLDNDLLNMEMLMYKELYERTQDELIESNQIIQDIVNKN